MKGSLWFFYIFSFTFLAAFFVSSTPFSPAFLVASAAFFALREQLKTEQTRTSAQALT